MRYVEHIADLIGNTPLVRLGAVAEDIAATVLAKVEYFNPGSSVKDRIALRMIEAAEASGELRPGATIVEPTSGNTGVGLALIAQRRGYRCVFVCPDKVSEDKRNVLRAYGAEVVVCPTAVAPEHPDSYYNVSDRLVTEIDGAWKPNQYANPENPRSHYLSTGPELWAQTEGRLTHFVAGIGTGGTISGTGRYLKEVSDGRVQIIGADPEGSVYSGGSGRPYLVEGVGEDFWPDTYDKQICDRIVAVSDSDSFAMTRRLAREEALLVGGSCGMAVVAALRVAAEAGPDDVVVVLLPDGGRGYLGKVFKDGRRPARGPPARSADVDRRDPPRRHRGHTDAQGGDQPSLRPGSCRARRRRKQAGSDPVQEPGGGPGGELPQDAARDGARHPRHHGQARRPHAQHADAGRDAAGQAPHGRARDARHLRADRAPARNARHQDRARGPGGSAPCIHAATA